jgi:hypothetical protein
MSGTIAAAATVTSAATPSTRRCRRSAVRLLQCAPARATDRRAGTRSSRISSGPSTRLTGNETISPMAANTPTSRTGAMSAVTSDTNPSAVVSAARMHGRLASATASLTASSTGCCSRSRW